MLLSLQIGSFVLGLLLLALGYSRRRRGLILLAALLLASPGAWPGFVQGVQDGFAHSGARPL